MEYNLSLDDIKILKGNKGNVEPSVIGEYSLSLEDVKITRSNQGEIKSSTVCEYDLTLDGIEIKRGIIGFRGNGVTAIETEESTVDGGNNKITIKTSDGLNKSFNVKNGKTGTAAGFDTPTIEIDDTYGTPEAEVVAEGEDTAKKFHFAFRHLKGNGIEDVQQTTTSTDDNGINEITFITSDGQTYKV